MSNENNRSNEKSGAKVDPGPHLARVVRSEDNKYMGTLHVQLLRDVGNIPNSEGSTYPVKYLSPFYGVTNIDHVGKNNTYNDTQKSYGMWMVPPTEGGIVVVMFIEGDTSNGFWLGCVQDEYMNFMIPGIAATELNTKIPPSKEPVAEYNKKITTGDQPDATQIKKPVHPFTGVLATQGLSTDEIRGTTTSSARRESPSNVFGISTPGPVDRLSGSARGAVGTKENSVQGSFVSRLGGTTLVMDDGDENYLRKGHASETASSYAPVGNPSGSKDIPHNELFRIRTRTGHQILMHNSEDLIYIGNARGTTWIELTSNGKIDIFAEDSISIHTKNDLNISADRDINMKAGRNVNLISGDKMHMDSGADWLVFVGADSKITVGGTSNINAGGNHIETASQIHMNGPSAATCGSANSPKRVPQHEPWFGHENLNPSGHTPARTDSSSSTLVIDGSQSKIVDTFKKIPNGRN
jgi:hypothetical protein